ncbi:MAG: ABC transporter ATP-binding protein [Clostridia bacterium]|nr:ABC transporter ATP-binding protein [Clostridia bacterium]
MVTEIEVCFSAVFCNTFIKLLCRLYDPTEGQIFLNGIDITRYKYDEYMDLFSVVFQDYTLFQFSIAQNIAASENYDPAEIESIMRKLGLGDLIDKNPRGLETPLGRDYEHDGVYLSRGESQKVALARALYKNAPFLVLDEPTAALDPVAEADVYARFNEIAREKTAIYISHRLSSCRFCDEILVFCDGEIVQRGKHDELVEIQDGKYAELWSAQAKYYN